MAVKRARDKPDNIYELGEARSQADDTTVAPAAPRKPVVAEFFAGIGLARMGLEKAGFDVQWSNDIEPFKRDMYVQHFGGTGHTFLLEDVAKVHASDMPEGLDLAWASFPCTDLSLAGNRSGFEGEHSSTFFGFTDVMEEMKEALRPTLIVLENVNGLATSHGGDDLETAILKLNHLGYSVDVMSIDARRFVPQSRPRLFLVGVRKHLAPVDEVQEDDVLRPEWLQSPFGDDALRTHRAKLEVHPPAPRTTGFTALAERIPLADKRWWDQDRTEDFLAQLSDIQLTRLGELQNQSEVSYRTAYRRTRQGKPAWEIRADDIAGCLRTARGGSSKQAVVMAGKGKVQVRWMTPREYAKLMGAPDYKFAPDLRDGQAYFGFGDAVCVDVIEWLATHYLMPVLEGKLAQPALDDTVNAAAKR